MLIQFTLLDLMFFLLGALGIAAGILLLSILWKIQKLLGILQPLVEINQEFIKKTIRIMPGIFENVEQISSNVRETTDKLKVSVPVIFQEIECVTNAAKGSIEVAGAAMENIGSGLNETLAAYKKDTLGFMAYFHIFEEALKIIYRILSSSK